MRETLHSQGRSHVNEIPGLSVPYHLVDEIRIELRRASLQARSSAARIHGGGGFRVRRSQRIYRHFLWISLLLLVVGPMTYVSAYLWAIPARYITESRITVVSQTDPMGGVLFNLMGRENSGQSYVTGYIESSNILSRLLNDNLNLIEESGVLDENLVYSATSQITPSLERKLELWKQNVIVERQSFTSTIELSVSALTAKSSLELHEKILKLAEDHINAISMRQRITQVSEATESLQDAQRYLREAIARLHDLRQKYNMIDPELEGTQRISLIYQLERQQADYKQRLEVLLRRNTSDPQIDQLSSQIEALENLKEVMRESIAGSISGTGATVAAAAAEMSIFESEVSIARDQVAQRMFELSEARQNATRQGMFLEKSVSPVLPQTPYKVPKLLYWIFALVGSIATWLVVAAMGALIRDHAR